MAFKAIVRVFGSLSLFLSLSASLLFYALQINDFFIRVGINDHSNDLYGWTLLDDDRRLSNIFTLLLNSLYTSHQYLTFFVLSQILFDRSIQLCHIPVWRNRSLMWMNSSEKWTLLLMLKQRRAEWTLNFTSLSLLLLLLSCLCFFQSFLFIVWTFTLAIVWLILFHKLKCEKKISKIIKAKWLLLIGAVSCQTISYSPINRQTYTAWIQGEQLW